MEISENAKLTLTTNGKKMVKPCGAMLAKIFHGSTPHNFQSISPSTISFFESLYVESLFAFASMYIRCSAYSSSSGFKNHAFPGPVANQNGVTSAKPMV